MTRTSIFRSLILLFPCFLCLLYELLTFMNSMLLLLFVLRLLESSAVGNAIEHTTKERSITNDLVEVIFGASVRSSQEQIFWIDIRLLLRMPCCPGVKSLLNRTEEQKTLLDLFKQTLLVEGYWTKKYCAHCRGLWYSGDGGR